MTTSKFCLQWDNHSENLSTNLGKLLENQILVDVSLTCQSQAIHVHKCILAACSPYFQERFEINSNIINIVMKNTELSTIKYLVEFMYTGKTYIPEEEIGSVINVATFFKIRGLSGINIETLGIDTTLKDFSATVEHPDFIAIESDDIIKHLRAEQNNLNSDSAVYEDTNQNSILNSVSAAYEDANQNNILNSDSAVYEDTNETNCQNTENIANSGVAVDENETNLEMLESQINLPKTQAAELKTMSDESQKNSINGEIVNSELGSNNSTSTVQFEEPLNFLSNISDVQKVLVQKLPTLCTTVNKLNIISRETINEMLMTNNISSTSVTTIQNQSSEQEPMECCVDNSDLSEPQEQTDCCVDNSDFPEPTDCCVDNSYSPEPQEPTPCCVDDSNLSEPQQQTNDAINYDEIQSQLAQLDGIELVEKDAETESSNKNDDSSVLKMLKNSGVPTDVPIFCEDSNGEIVELSREAWKEIAEGGQFVYQIVNEEGQPSELFLGGNDLSGIMRSEDSVGLDLTENQYETDDLESVIPKYILNSKSKHPQSNCYESQMNTVETSYNLNNIDSRVLREQEIIGDDDQNSINEDVMLSLHNRNAETPEVLESEQQRMLLTPDSSLRLEQKESYDDFYNSNIDINEKIINETKSLDAEEKIVNAKNIRLIKSRRNIKRLLPSQRRLYINKSLSNKATVFSKMVKNTIKENLSRTERKLRSKTPNDTQQNDNVEVKIRVSSRPSTSSLKRPATVNKNSETDKNKKRILSKRIVKRKKSTKSESEKDIPYALGLLPLDTALKKIQNMPEHTPRMTRSSAGLVISEDNKDTSENTSSSKENYSGQLDSKSSTTKQNDKDNPRLRKRRMYK